MSLAVTEWVGHTAWTLTRWLLHLLRADIDVPPNWEMNRDIVVLNVSDLSGANRSWISLDIDRLERVLKLNVSEGHSSDTAVI